MRQAVLLAGGRGTRLGPYTANFPKPLMPLDDRMPVLELLLRQLRAAGCQEATLAVNHFHLLLRAYFGEGERLGLAIRYALEAAPLGTAGPLAALLDGLDENFLVANGDLLTTLDFRAMAVAHAASGADATVAAVRRQEKIEFGLLELGPGTQLRGYVEKPIREDVVSIGCYLFRREALRPLLRPGAFLDMPDLIRALLAAGRDVRVHLTQAFWLDIGRPDDYARAQAAFAAEPERFLPPGQAQPA